MLTLASDSRLRSKELEDFWRTGSDFNAQLLRAQLRMCRREPHRSRFFLRSNPDSARSADQRKGVVADNLRRAFQVQLDGVVCKWPDGAKFVGYAQNDAGGISAIRNESSVVRQQRKFLVDTSAGQRLNNHLLSVQIAFHAEISPVAHGVLQI